jgi:hypothetical protein
MKQKTLIYLAAALLSLAACNRKVATPTVDVLSQEAQGLLLIKADGIGNRQIKSEDAAQQLVLDRLLYTGIPDETVTAARLPLIEDRTKLDASARAKLAKLLEPANAKRYFVGMTNTGAGPSVNSANRLNRTYTFKVNTDLLRKDLEQQQIIRKFGL